MKVTAISPGTEDPRETAPSPLSSASPGPGRADGPVPRVKAGWTPEDLEACGGDPEFTAEVQAAMRALRATGGAR